MLFKSFFLIYYLYIAVISYGNIYLDGIGISASQIGYMVSTARAISILILPVWGMAADYFGATKKVLKLAVGGTIISLLAFPQTEIYWMIFIIYIIFIFFEAPIVSLSDALVLNHLKDNSDQYGRFRSWGSIGYMLAVTPVGFMIERTGARNIFFLGALVMIIALVNVFKLPKGGRSIKIAKITDFKLILKNKKLFKFLLFTFFIQMPLIANFTFYPIFFKSLGGGETLLGLALLIGAGSELVVFQKSPFFFKNFSLKTILLISAVSFSIRWALIGFFPFTTVLVLTQLLHSLTFALFHVTAVRHISKLVGLDFQATGQNLYASTIALSTVTGSLLGGIIYDFSGGASLYLIGSFISITAGIIYFYHLKRNEALTEARA
ncbi:MAG: MFS transporter [Bacillota bacterium]